MSSRFTQPLFLVPLAHLDLAADDKVSILMNPDFCFEVGHLGSEEQICVPLGFLTDLASVPRLLRWVVNPSGARISRAAVIHDLLYRSREMRERYNRKQADAIMKDAMRAAGCSKAHSQIVYLALRLGGFFAWRSGGTKEIHELVLPASELPTLVQNSNKGLETHGDIRLTGPMVDKPLAK